VDARKNALHVKEVYMIPHRYTPSSLLDELWLSIELHRRSLTAARIPVEVERLSDDRSSAQSPRSLEIAAIAIGGNVTDLVVVHDSAPPAASSDGFVQYAITFGGIAPEVHVRAYFIRRCSEP
jgi:hypothetical protein